MAWIDIRGRPDHCLRRSAVAGARTRRPPSRGNRRADGRAVVSRRQAGENEAESLFARVDPGKMMVTFDRRLLAMRLRHFQGTIRRGEGEGTARAAPTTLRGWCRPQIGIVGGEKLGRRQAADGCGQPAEALDAAGTVVHRRRRACDVADRRRRRHLAVQDAVATANLLASKADERLSVGGRTRCRAPAP